MKHISLERLWNKGRKTGVILFVLVMLISVTSCGYIETAKESPSESQETEIVQDNESEQEADTMVFAINGEIVSVDWEDNESVVSLMDLVMTEPLSIQMSMYGGFEQVGSIGTSLPRNDVQTTTEAGDIVLYSGNQVVVFYGSNSWAYSRLGKVTDKSKAEMTELFGNKDVKITISME
ncbi:MAG: hypothetical protein IJG57_03180 [Firmicutes bacterium]|nr:hypothetical protein [Bacillota bacterium]